MHYNALLKLGILASLDFRLTWLIAVLSYKIHVTNHRFSLQEVRLYENFISTQVIQILLCCTHMIEHCLQVTYIIA